MKKPIILFFLLISHFSFLISHLSASGQTADEETTLNNEWLLCVTAFDYSALSPARVISGEVMTRDLVNKLRAVIYRLRISPEYAYYESYAWRQSVLAAARALSNKQDERSLLLYRGEPEWRYQRNLKNIDTQIEKLREDLERIEAEKPLINNEPSFNLIQTNLSGTYPAPPEPGQEYRFCQTQKCDGILFGQVLDYHGRFYIRVRLYALYTQSVVYEDDIIFSMDDSEIAMDEITARLTAVLAGNRPAVITVRADPPEAQILINQNYAGRGTVDVREQPPGKITVSVAAEGYNSEVVETELSAGELTEIDVSLSPMQFAEVNVNVPAATPGQDNVLVYHGSMFMGFAPLTLPLPVNQLDYVTAEQRRGGAAKAVFNTPEMPGETFNLTFTLKLPHPGEHRVNKARGRAYWAWGGIWITGIAWWLTNGIYTSYKNGLPQSSSPDYRASASGMYYVNTGALILLGAAVVHNLIQMPIYLYTAGQNVTPIVKKK
jgi:hypothetical protein